MNREITNNKAAQRYDAALLESRRRRKPPSGIVEPQPTDAWPAENVELLARYWCWLEEENSTLNCIEQIYIPMAGHVLGLNLKPHDQMDISASSTQALGKDLERALDYIKARGL